MAIDQDLSRLPASNLVATYLEHAGSILLVVAIMVVTRSVDQLDAPRWLLVLLGATLLVRIVHPVYTWTTLKHRTDAHGITQRRGLVFVRERTLRWEDVSTVQVDEPWNLRLFSLARVSYRQTGDETVELSIPGVRLEDLPRLRGHGASSPPGASHDTEAPEPALIHHAGPLDLVLASAVQGRIVTLGLAALALGLDLVDRVDVETPLLRAASEHPVPAALVAAVVLLTAGALSMIIRFHGLQSTVDATGVRVRYGLFTRRERHISSASIVGIELRRNVVEIGLDRVRATLISRDSHSQLGANLVLPSLRTEVAWRILDSAAFDSLAVRQAARARSPLSLVRAMLLGVAPVAAAGTAAILGARVLSDRPAVVIGAGLVAALAAVMAGNLLRTTMRADVGRGDGTVAISTRNISDRLRLLRGSDLHLAGALRWRDRSTAMVRLHYFAGGPRTASAIVRGYADDELVRMVCARDAGRGRATASLSRAPSADRKAAP